LTDGTGPGTVAVVLALCCALVGQLYLAFCKEYWWDGAVLWFLAIILLAASRVRNPFGSLECALDRLAVWLRAQRPRISLGVLGLALSLVAGFQARGMPANSDFTWPLLLWLAGVGAFLLCLVRLPQGRRGTDWLNLRWRRRNAEVVCVALLASCALAIRGLCLAQVPANLGGDEGIQGVAAQRLIEAPLGNPFSTGWYSVPTMSFLAWGLSMTVAGGGVAGLRALSALLGTATVIATLLLAKAQWGRRVGYLAAAVLACMHYHVHFSRLGSNQIGDGLVMSAALWLLSCGVRTRRAIYFGLAGVTIGAGWYGYFGARLTGVVAAGYLCYLALSRTRFLAEYWRYLALLVAGALVVAAPLALHYLSYPDEAMARARQVNIFDSQWLSTEQALTGRTAASLLLEQAWKAFTAFHMTLDPTFWYHPSIPLLDVVSGVLFSVGLLVAVRRFRQPAGAMLLIWLGVALFLGWVLTENPPSSMRMTNTAPALAILVALGLDWVVGRVLAGLQAQEWYYQVVSVAIAALATLNTVYYFLVYSPARVYGNPTAETATELGRDLGSGEDGAVVRFHGAPFLYWGFGTLQFLLPDTDGEDVPPPAEGRSEMLRPGDGAGVRFIFVPERLGELREVRASYPGGTQREVRSAADERVLYVVYEVKPVEG
jgi:hypothetical protein